LRNAADIDAFEARRPVWKPAVPLATTG
jgi:hypothetical protein